MTQWVEPGCVVDALPGLIWTAQLDGSVDYVNNRWCAYTGLTAEQLAGRGWQDAIHPEDLPDLGSRWQAILQSRQPGDAQARLRRIDGVYRWFHVRAEPFRDERGTVTRWYGLLTDIEEQRKTEDALRTTSKRLAAAAQRATVAQLLAFIAHEINQPLSGIITNAGTCLRMLAAEPPNLVVARETVRRTIRDGERASEVVLRLRALFAKADVTVEPVDLNVAMREVIDIMTSDLQRGRVIVRANFANHLPSVMGNRVQLQQVILNLILNACHAMSHVEDRPRRLLLTTALDGESVRLSVQDAGVGLERDHLEKVFELFFTTSSSGMGTGLTISRSIVESHQGRLWAAANDGPGTTFSFSIPLPRAR